MSSLGKGISASSIGLLLECCGLRVTLQKLDPYINVDPGTMNPFEHGEVFVTDDGAETDLDLGHYERFTKALPRQEKQSDKRQDLRFRYFQGEGRQVSRQNSPGNPSRNR